MSLSDPQVRHPDIFANTKFWVDQSISQRDKVLSNIETYGGSLVLTPQNADYAVVPQVMSDEVQRDVKLSGTRSVVSTWISQSIEANRPVPPEGFAPSVAPQVIAVPPVSTLQKESSSVSGESTVVESPAAVGSLRPATNGDASTTSHGSPTEPTLDANGGDGESEIDELDQSTYPELESKRRRGKAYSPEDIQAMQRHFKAQMELNPRPSHSAIWETFAYSHPYRKASSWQQYFYNHKALFLPEGTSAPPRTNSTTEGAESATPNGLPPSASSPAHPTPKRGAGSAKPPNEAAASFEAWDEEDEIALVNFLAENSNKAQFGVTDWAQMASRSGKSRSGRSYMMKYHKNRANYDQKAGRPPPPPALWYNGPPLGDSQATKQTAFVPLATASPTTAENPASLKRSRPSDFEALDQGGDRPVRARARRQSYAEDGGDEGYDEDEEIADGTALGLVVETAAAAAVNDLSLTQRVTPRSPSSAMDYSYTAARQQPPTPRASTSAGGPAPSPSPAAGGSAPASWMSPFTPEDKSEALKWAVSRSQPVDLLDNMRSWIEFAESHPSHTAPEWVCHYLSHYPTFQSVESNLGAF